MGTKDPLSTDTIKMLMELNADGWDIYYIPNEVSSDFCGVKPRDKDIVRYTRFIVDIDPKEPLANRAHATQVLDQIHDAVPYYVAIFTGNGLQLHIMDNDNPLPVPQTTARVSAYLHRISHTIPPLVTAASIKVDTSTSDASRMVRLPHTINWKTSVRGLYLYSTSSWSPTLHCGFAALPEPATLPAPPPPVADKYLTNLSAIAPRLTLTASTFLLHGVEHDTRGRHQAAYATAACLRRLGVAQDVATAWVLNGAAMCTPPLPEGDAIACVKSAYKNN